MTCNAYIKKNEYSRKKSKYCRRKSKYLGYCFIHSGTHLIGSGTYGKVYLGNKNNKKIVEKYMDFDATTFIEITFFKQYCIKEQNIFPVFIDVLYNDITNLYIIKMSYEGPTLNKVMIALSYKNRLKYLPILISQFASILDWFSRKSIIHMDLKMSNVCWGKSRCPHIKIIDFGFAIKQIDDFQRTHTGTYKYADPSYKIKRVHYTFYDMFSVGIILVNWLFKIESYVELSKVTNDTDVLILYDIHQFNNSVPKNQLNCIKKMLLIDEQKRIKPSEILLEFNKPKYMKCPEISYIYKNIKYNKYNNDIYEYLNSVGEYNCLNSVEKDIWNIIVENDYNLHLF